MGLFQPHLMISSITNITAATTAHATAIRAANTPPTIEPTLLASSAMVKKVEGLIILSYIIIMHNWISMASEVRHCGSQLPAFICTSVDFEIILQEVGTMIDITVG